LNLVGCIVGIVNANVGIDGAVVGKYEYPTGCDGGKVNIEKITKPIRRKPLIVEKTQNGDGLGATCNGGFFMPAVKKKRNKLFKRMKGVMIKEITPHQPRSIVLPVKVQK
jgi:hypothetical protein